MTTLELEFTQKQAMALGLQEGDMLSLPAGDWVIERLDRDARHEVVWASLRRID